MNTGGKYIANERVKHPYSWAKTTVYQILSNSVYLGKLVSQRYTTRSFKDKRIVERPPEEWVIVENTHEPLVDQAIFDTVQERIKIKQPATWTNTDNMFRGLMICGGCNTRMVFTTRKNCKSKGHFGCNTHRRQRRLWRQCPEGRCCDHQRRLLLRRRYCCAGPEGYAGHQWRHLCL